jgi:hypothetical protein
MKNLPQIALLVFLLISTSCVQSLNPLYTEPDLIFDPALLGVWIDKESTETWELTKIEDKQYKLIHTDENGKKGEFVAHLLKIDGKTFLDLVPIDSGLSPNDFYKGHFLATHSFILITQMGSTFQISYLEPDWLKNLLKENPQAIRHEKMEEKILLTASSKELQKILLANLNSAFSRPVEITRKK